MVAPASTEKAPSIDALGRDLLVVSPWQRVQSILRPVTCAALYFVFAAQGWWVAAVAAVAGLMFITYVSTSHDLLHRTLGLSRPLNEFLLSAVELLALRSGHAFRVSHLCHHRCFPEEEDVEGRVARMPAWRALLEGIGNQTRLFIWSFRRARTGERRWMAAEAGLVVTFIVISVVVYPRTPILLVYVVLVTTSSWLYPVATVWVPHRAEGTDELSRTRALRGRIVPELFLQHTYHLEHHLYPSVPSFNWKKLADRLDPYLRSQGVQPLLTP
jgi:beta-carotene hydroxylase